MEQHGTIGTVLVVDDEESIRFGLSAYLQDQGYTVETVGTGAEAAARLAARPYAVVIADLHLSRANTSEGLDLIRATRTLAPRTRMILMTAFATPAIIAEARSLGCDVIFDKPFSLDAMARVLADLMPRRHEGKRFSS
jgi:CheY-like chemotaxis protein